MMVQSVHRYLVEFKPDEPIETLREAANEHDRERSSPFPTPEAPDTDALIEEAYRRGCEETALRAEAEREAAIAIIREEAYAALAAARAQWASEESEAIALQLSEGLAALEARLAEKTARALRPFLREAVREQAIAALCETLSRLLHSQPSATLEMSGPQDLLDAVMQRLDAEGAQRKISLDVTGGHDIRIVCDETTIETQISLWAGSLAIDGA